VERASNELMVQTMLDLAKAQQFKQLAYQAIVDEHK